MASIFDSIPAKIETPQALVKLDVELSQMESYHFIQI